MKKAAVILTVILLGLMCGCTGYREIDRGYLATAIAFSSNGEKIDIIIEALSSSYSPDTPPDTQILTASGDTANQAFNLLKSQLVKPVYFEQLGTVVLDLNLSDTEKQDIMRFLKSLQRISLGVCFVNTADADALFKADTPNGILGYDIVGLIKNFEKENGKKILNRFYQIEKGDGVLPLVNTNEKQLSIIGE